MRRLLLRCDERCIHVGCSVAALISFAGCQRLMLQHGLCQVSLRASKPP